MSLGPSKYPFLSLSYSLSLSLFRGRTCSVYLVYLFLAFLALKAPDNVIFSLHFFLLSEMHFFLCCRYLLILWQYCRRFCHCCYNLYICCLNLFLSLLSSLLSFTLSFRFFSRFSSPFLYRIFMNIIKSMIKAQ